MTTHRAASAAVDTAAVRPGRVDGRKRRWHQHKIDRREELVDGTLAAIRNRGGDVGMDEIAAEIGVSKTVLYRYFSDKSDLTRATMERFIETTLMPRIYEAISDDADEYQLVRNTLAAYVHTVEADIDVYRFIMGNGSTTDKSSLADFEKLFADVVSVVVQTKAFDRGVDTEGVLLYSYVIVGGVQLATDWWISNRSMSADRMLDHLAMMVWSAIEGMVRAGGSPEKFNAVPHELPEADLG
ncbi:TetR family transcriptional regulator [Nocardia sp. MDA0666]|uniref:TetR/AcrR family transcriptional regulator n=1 Tax=Nocardia sp. MDA0666 TaxID=2135448 RepID=UPI000D1293E4|nr:TetR/AcrR family transcriptional regulator [Nocardia sp. MDA0666]PSR64397.1 TetR family transcriptional regulator [Nocardia sp. MDA0666]